MLCRHRAGGRSVGRATAVGSPPCARWDTTRRELHDRDDPFNRVSRVWCDIVMLAFELGSAKGTLGFTTAPAQRPRVRRMLAGDLPGLVKSQQKVTASPVQRRASLYVRQSTLPQVLENTESTARQYALRQRAIALGWPAAQSSSSTPISDSRALRQSTATVFRRSWRGNRRQAVRMCSR